MQAQPTPRSAQSGASSLPSLSLHERAQRHLKRAQEQFKMKKYNEAVTELRDAIKVDPSQSEFHAWLAKVHLEKGLPGMAAISVRQALKLNSQDELALECQKRIEAIAPTSDAAKTEKPATGLAGLLSRKLF